MRDKIKDLAIVYQGNYNKILTAIKNQDWVSPQITQYKTVVIYDADYPKSLYRLQYPPLVLFYEGNINLFNKTSVSVVGSRTLDDYSSLATIELVSLVSEKKVIVSGCALGIDALAHQAAMHKGQTIGILGCGLSVNYPKQNRNLIQQIREHHLLVSEFPDHTPPLKHHFPWRNRLIAASSQQLWVMSGRYKSGTMHTLNQAMEMECDIYALPHHYDSELGEAPHYAISNGANILNRESILEDLKQNQRSNE